MVKDMKILLINKFHYMRGGSETYYFAQAEALQRKGHEVIFFAMSDPQNLECDQKEYFVPNVDYNLGKGITSKMKMVRNFFYSRAAATKMEELVKKEKPDIAHVGLLHRQITFSVIDVLKKYNIPIVMTMHDLIFACPNYTMLTNGKVCEKCLNGSVINCIIGKCVKNSVLKSTLAAIEKIYLLKKAYYNKIDLFITECKFYESLLKKSGVTTSKVITMTNFLPINQEYKPYYESQDYVLYFGRFSREKGLMTLLKAQEATKCRHKLILVGKGPIEEEMTDFIKTHNLTNVEIPGPIYGKDMEKIIEDAKTIIVPSEWYENCPYALLQSIAKGKVVIASKMGGLPELIEDGNTGFLFEPGNVIELSKKIEQVMMMDEITYKNMSIKIATDAMKKHHWEWYMDSLIKEYEEFLKKPKSRK